MAFCFFVAPCFAQKLPDVQTTNITAPSNVKIDGKTTEWNDTFAAENKRTEVYYTLANDDKNLYLILKSSSSANAGKIIAGGLTFNINTQGKKKEKDAFSITYPLIKRAAVGGRGGQGQGQGQNRQGAGQGGLQNRAQQTQQQRDSTALVQRKNQLATVKEIKISGFKAITDTLISIYNEYGIKAVGSFDVKGDFVYELAIPLSLLELSVNDSKEFVYQIKINGLSNTGFGGGNNGGRTFAGNAGGNGGGNFGAARGNAGGGFNGGGSGMDMMSPTDFWGKYSFTKK